MSDLIFNYRVVWSDLDANQHMGNTAYYDYASQTRFDQLEADGWGYKRLIENNIGMVALEENMRYLREFHLGEKLSVQLQCGGMNESRSRFIYVNNFFAPDGTLAAQLRSMILWMDLTKRKSMTPPDELSASIENLPRSDDYKDL